jgi:two-component system NtrC family sensor kinase
VGERRMSRDGQTPSGDARGADGVGARPDPGDPGDAVGTPPARAPRRLHGPRLSVGVKLFLGLFSAIAVVFFAFSYFTARSTSDAWAQSFDEHATQTTAVTERVLRQGMLFRNKEAVHAALRDLASAPGIKSIRIYDKNGVIRFSTDERELGTHVAKSAEVCVICHGAPFRAARDESFSRVLRDSGPGAVPVMGQARVIKNGVSCAGDKCHASPEKKAYLGVMDFQTSMAAVERANDVAKTNTAYAAVVMALAGGLATFLMIWRFVRRPVVELVGGTRAVAAGKLETRLKLGHSVEFHEIAQAFNQMTSDLGVARERQQKWEESLAQAIEIKTAELATAHRRMAHMEKMASLGKLAAMVAHEINNPLAGILVYAKLLLRGLGTANVSEEERTESLRYIEVIRQESTRCGEIVKNLLSFARQSRTPFAEHSLAVILDRSIMTVQHLLKTKSIECTVEPLAGDDTVLCDANEIQQALVALLVNAVEAMPNGGALRISLTPKGDDHVVIAVADTGVGIAPEVLPEIFEPFFSTKGDEKGVGLGLAAVYGIVRRHEATIDVESEVGEGATFRITLPRRPKSQGRVEAGASERPTKPAEPG